MKNKRIRSKSILALLTLALAVGFVGLNNKTNFKVDAAPIEVTTGYQEEVNYAPVYPTNLPEGINLSKLRIWVERRDHYMDGFTYLLRIGSDYYRPSGYHEALQPTNAWFPFYDISISLVNGADVGLSVLNDSNNEIALDIPAQTFVPGDNSKVWVVNYDLGSGAWSYTKGKVIIKIYNTFGAKVLEGYLSCSPSIHNGYAAYELVRDNFIVRSGTDHWNIYGDLGSVNVDDFANVSDYETGTRTANLVDAYTKFLMLEANYDASQGGSPVQYTNNNQTTITIMVVLTIIAVLGISYVGRSSIRKKREMN